MSFPVHLMAPPTTKANGKVRSSPWSRAAFNLSHVLGPQLAAPPVVVVPDEDEAWIADQPDINFDAALLTTALGMARRPFAAGEAIALGRRLARRPGRLAAPLAGLAGEAARIATGRSAIDPVRSDRRYADRAWQGNPLFRVLAQGHVAVATTVDDVLDRAALQPATDYRLRLAADNLVAALAPANFPLLNPAALKAMIDTGGGSLLVGARRMREDLGKPPHLPARSDPGEFRLGEDLAATPGAVVLRTPVMELIQYEATTDQVREEPLLVVPSLVNKYYLTDLSPGRSLVEYAVNSGLQTFHISWINPTTDHRHFRLDTYIDAIVEAIDTVRKITGAERAHALGVCAGGQLLTIALAHLAGLERQDEVASMTLTVAVLDHDDPATPAGLLSRETAEVAMGRIDRAGLVDGRRLSLSLAWLRPVDSIWWAWVQRYLLAVDIPRMDLFHWSEDTTNLPAALVRDLLELTLENKLTKPGSLTVMGLPVDLSRVVIPAYLIAGLTDNLTPWRGCYRTSRMLGSRASFVLVSGGHLQAILRPPGGRSAGYRTASGTPRDADAWLERSTEHNTSWWDHWLKWVERRSSGIRPAPQALGDAAHPVIESAPGTYARRRLDGAPQ